MTPTLNVNLEEFKKMFFSAVMTPVERMQRKNAEILAAQCRKAAQNSMKKAAKLSKKKFSALKSSGGEVYSQPGQPPLEKVGLLKKHLYYGWDARTKSAVAGPTKLNMRGQVPRSLEFGEPTLISVPQTRWIGRGVKATVARKIIEVPMAARPYMGPARDKVTTPANLKRVYEKSLKAQKGF